MKKRKKRDKETSILEIVLLSLFGAFFGIWLVLMPFRDSFKVKEVKERVLYTDTTTPTTSITN